MLLELELELGQVQVQGQLQGQPQGQPQEQRQVQPQEQPQEQPQSQAEEWQQLEVGLQSELGVQFALAEQALSPLVWLSALQPRCRLELPSYLQPSYLVFRHEFIIRYNAVETEVFAHNNVIRKYVRLTLKHWELSGTVEIKQHQEHHSQLMDRCGQQNVLKTCNLCCTQDQKLMCTIPIVFMGGAFGEGGLGGDFGDFLGGDGEVEFRPPRSLDRKNTTWACTCGSTFPSFWPPGHGALPATGMSHTSSLKINSSEYSGWTWWYAQIEKENPATKLCR